MIRGGCLCGAVRYETEAQPIVARYCWCRVCQYLALGNAAVSVCFPTAAGVGVVLMSGGGLIEALLAFLQSPEGQALIAALVKVLVAVLNG